MVGNAHLDSAKNEPGKQSRLVRHCLPCVFHCLHMIKTAFALCVPPHFFSQTMSSPCALLCPPQTQSGPLTAILAGLKSDADCPVVLGADLNATR